MPGIPFFAQGPVQHGIEAGMDPVVQFVGTGIRAAEIAQRGIVELHHVTPDARFQLCTELAQLVARTVTPPEAKGGKIHAAVGGGVEFCSSVMFAVARQHLVGILQGILAVLRDLQPGAEIIQLKDMHALDIRVQGRKVGAAALNGADEGFSGTLLHPQNACRREAVREMLQQHGKTHENKFTAVGFIGRPYDRRAFEERLPQDFFDFPGLISQFRGVFQVQAERIGQPFIETVGVIASVQTEASVIQNTGRGHRGSVVSIDPVEYFGGGIDLHINDGMNDFLCLFDTVRRVQQHQAQRIVQGRTCTVKPARAVLHADQAALRIIPWIQTFHRLIHQNFALMAQLFIQFAWHRCCLLFTCHGSDRENCRSKCMVMVSGERTRAG